MSIIISLYPLMTPPQIDGSKDGMIALKLDKHIINILAVGQQRMLSSFFWIESMLNASHDHHGDDEEDMSPLYYKYKTIADLDEYFYELYYNGGVYLSIIKDDEQGAKRIYERGLSIFPKDYYLLLNAGFHYYFELDDEVNAIDTFERVINLHQQKVPDYITILLARLRTKEVGGIEAARIIIYEAWKNSPPHSPQKKKLFNRLYSIQAEIDLNCLNSENGERCNRSDIEGNPYLLENNTYIAPRKWKKFRVIDKIRN